MSTTPVNASTTTTVNERLSFSSSIFIWCTDCTDDVPSGDDFMLYMAKTGRGRAALLLCAKMQSKKSEG